MKRLFVKALLAAVLLLCADAAAAQSDKFKYGQVKAEDFQVRPCDRDSDAAVIFIEDIDHYDFYLAPYLTLHHEHDARILVLKDDGKEYANFEVPSSVSSFKACAINMADGKPVRTDVKKDNVNVEKMAKGTKKVKIKKYAVPEVRVGTIIDVHYEEDMGWERSILFQRSAPIKHRLMEYNMPDFILCSINMHGFLNATPKITKNTIRIGGGHYEARNFFFEMTDVPSLKKDEYVYCIDDYRGGLELQYDGFNLPGKAWSVDVYDKWPEVFKALAKDEDFGLQLKMKNPLAEETAAIAATERSDEEKIMALARLVQEKIKWNKGVSKFTDEGIRKALKDGEGNMAEMNFLLAIMLKDAGYETDIILLNPRSLGFLPYGRPFINKINAPVVQVKTKDGKVHYIDASDKYGWLDVMNPEYLVDRALVYDTKVEYEDEVKLKNLTTSRQKEQYQCTLQADGKITGFSRTSMSNQFARKYKAQHADDTDDEREKQTEAYEEAHDISISDFTVVGMDSTAVNISLNFEKDADVSADGRITLNPTIVPLYEENPFTEKTRVLPVEYPYPAMYTTTSSITLPEGYVVEELPQPIHFNACEGKLDMKYNIVSQGNRVMTNATFTIKDTWLSAESYEDISLFYDELCRLANIKIVIKPGA